MVKFTRFTLHSAALPLALVTELSQLGKFVDSYVNAGGTTVTTYDAKAEYAPIAQMVLDMNNVEYVA